MPWQDDLNLLLTNQKKPTTPTTSSGNSDLDLLFNTKPRSSYSGGEVATNIFNKVKSTVGDFLHLGKDPYTHSADEYAGMTNGERLAAYQKEAAAATKAATIENSFLGTEKNIVTGLPKAFKDTAIDFGQYGARAIATFGVTAANSYGKNKVFDSEIPTTGNKITEAVFGGKPIRDIENAGRNVIDQIDTLRTTLAGGKEIKPLPKSLAIPFGIVGSLFDLSGFSGGKQGVKAFVDEIPEQVLKFWAKEKNPFIIEKMMTASKIPKNIALELSPKLAKTNTVDEVKDVLLNTVKTGPKAANVTEKAQIEDMVKNTVDNTAPAQETKSLSTLPVKEVVPTKSPTISSLLVISKNSLVTPTGNLEPLLEEAKKYKSAEEFLASQKPIYRGQISDTFNENLLSNGADAERSIPRSSFSTNKEVAQSFGKNIFERYISPNTKILKGEDIPPSVIKTAKKPDLYGDGFGEITRYAKENGYDGVDLSSLSKYKIWGKTPEDEIRIINPKVLQTKEQLTDIYNKAVEENKPAKIETTPEQQDIQAEMIAVGSDLNNNAITQSEANIKLGKLTKRFDAITETEGTPKLETIENLKFDRNLEELKAGLKKIYGKDIPVEIGTFKNPNQLGGVIGDTIRLLEREGGLSEVVANHEGYHWFKKTLNDADLVEVNAIEREFVKKNLERVASLKAAGYTDAQIPEELMADEAAKYFRTGKTFSERIKLFFDRMIQRLKQLFSKKDEVLELFKNIKTKVGKKVREGPDRQFIEREKTPKEILAEAEAKAKQPGGQQDRIKGLAEIARNSENYTDFIYKISNNKLLKQWRQDLIETGYGHFEPFFKQQKVLAKEVVPKVEKSTMKPIADVIKASTPTKAEIAQIKKERSIPVSRIQLPDELQAMRDEIDARKEALIDNRAESLEKYIVRSGDFAGKLPEVIGNTDATYLSRIKDKNVLDFAKRGDQIVTEFGFASVEEAEQALMEFIQDKETLKELQVIYRGAKKAFLTEERDRFALEGLIAREERINALNKVATILRKEGRDRANKVKAVQDYFKLTDGEVKKIIKGTDFRLISDKEFEDLMKKLQGMAYDIEQRRELAQQIQITIDQLELKKVENLQQALKMPKIKNMTAPQLIKFNDLLNTFKEKDKFLGVRQIQTMANTDLAQAKTHREILEGVLGKKGPLSTEQLANIKTTDLDEFRSAASLARQNVFYEVMVEEMYKQKIEANARFQVINDEFQELIKKARASRPRRLLDKLVPTDELIVKWLEEEDPATKIKISEQMTPEEMDAAVFVRDTYSEMRDYLLSKDMLKKYIENYYTHRPRTFLESWLKNEFDSVVPSVDGTMKTSKFNFFKQFTRALKETFFDTHKLDEATFKILDEKTETILPLEKFFKYSMKRSGNLIPTKNVARAFLGYVKTFEQKRGLDSYLPKMDAVASALTPEMTTEKGLIKDDSLHRFVRKWINTQKGRPVALSALKPGNTVDTAIRAATAFVRFIDLALRVPVQLVSGIGEQVMTIGPMGPKKYATGLQRSLTKEGKAIVKKYEGFVGETILDRLRDQSKDAGTKFGELLFGFYGSASRQANIIKLLGEMTDAEFKAGEITGDRLAQIRRDISAWRADELLSSVLGKTSVGGVFRQHRSWAMPIITTTTSHLNTLLKMAKEGKNPTNSKEFGELLRTSIVASIVVLTAYGAYSELQNKDNKGFLQTLAYKGLQDALSFIQALDPTTWTNTARLISFINDLGGALKATAVGITTGDTDTEGNVSGFKRLKSIVVPKVLRGSGASKEEKAKMAIKEVYFAGDAAKTKELIAQAVTDGYISTSSLNAYKTSLRKEKKIKELFTTSTEKKWVDRLNKITTNEDKVIVIQEMRKSMSDAAFREFWKKGRSTVQSTASGKNIPILISDNLRELYLETLK